METSEGETGNRNVGQVYRCFLVRCRLEEAAGPDRAPSWRFTVQQVGPDGVRRSFAFLHDVEVYLDAELVACGQDVARE